MKVLKKIRNNTYLNKAVRGLLKYSLLNLNKISQRWPVSGAISIKLDGQKFGFFAKSDDGTISNLYYNQAYMEAGELKLFFHLAKESNVIIDVGANTGLYSIVSAVDNQNASIYAFEPNPVNLVRLKENIQLNQLKNITLIEKALGSSAKTVSFYIPTEDRISDTSSVIPEFSKSTYEGKIEWKEIKVQQTSLDHLSDIYKFKGVELIKIDVEGYEVDVFEGAKDFFKKYAPIVLCEIFLSDDKKEYFNQFLKAYGYHAYLVVKEGLIRLDEGMIPNHDGMNFLFVKGRTKEVFSSFRLMDDLVKELKKITISNHTHQISQS